MTESFIKKKETHTQSTRHSGTMTAGPALGN